MKHGSFREAVATESLITSPKSKSPRASARLCGVEMFSVKQPRYNNDEAFEHISSDEDTPIAPDSYQPAIATKIVSSDRVSAISQDCQVLETPHIQRQEPQGMQLMQIATGPKQAMHVEVIKFKPMKPIQLLDSFSGERELMTCSDLNATIRQSQSSENSLTEIQEEVSVRNFVSIRTAQSPSISLGLTHPNRFQQVQAKEMEQSLVDQGSIMSGGASFKEAIRVSRVSRQEQIETIACNNENRMLISVLGKSRYSQLEADANMILTDDEDDKKVKFLLTKSKHDMGSFVNIETAIDQHEQTKPQLKEVKNQLSGMIKQRNESNEILKQVSTGIKTLRPSDLIPTLRVIDLSSNRLRSLPDELTSLINLVDLRMDHNLIKKLPSQFWRLKQLKELVLSHNQIDCLPENFHWLQALEVFKIDYNRLSYLPNTIGVMVCLRKLYLHENRLTHLPRELANLTSLIEFSTEWFLYTKPSNAKIQKNPDVIKSIRDFCQTYQFAGVQPRFVPRHFIIPKSNHASELFDPSEAQSEDCLASQLSSHSSIRKKPINSSMPLQKAPAPFTRPAPQHFRSNTRLVSFTDFLLHYHKVSHHDVWKLNEIEYSVKKRSLVHQICSNMHFHLMSHILGHDQPDSASAASRQFAAMLDLNVRDAQNITPACQLVMSFTLECNSEHNSKRKKVPGDNHLIGQKQDQRQASPAGTPCDSDGTNSSFIDSDVSESSGQASRLNRRRERILKLILEVKDANGNQKVYLNDEVMDVPDEHLFNHTTKVQLKATTLMKDSTVTEKDKTLAVTQFIKSKPQEQHNILFWALFKCRFDLAYELICKYQADCKIVNSNGASLLHILFASFDQDPINAERLARLLLEVHGLDPNIKDNDGKTPLHVAIGKGQQHPFDFVIQHHLRECRDVFDFDVEDNNGKTSLHYAIKKSNYDAFIFLLNHRLSDCFLRDVEFKTPRQNSFINTGFYRVLIREEKNYVLRLIHGSHEEERTGAGTRCTKEDLQLLYKYCNTESAFETVRSKMGQMAPDEHLQISAAKTIKEMNEEVPQLTEDWVSCSAVPINAPNASQTLEHQLSDKPVQIFQGQYPPRQLGRANELSKDASSEQLMLVHIAISSRAIKKVPQLDQLEFTLGMPRSSRQPQRSPQFASSLQDLAGQTDRNSDVSADHPSSFELLIKQDIVRPDIKGATEQVPQKSVDHGLTQYATADCKTIDGWTMLSSSQQEKKRDSQIPAEIQSSTDHNQTIISQQTFKQLPGVSPTNINPKKLIKEAAEQIGQRSPYFKKSSSPSESPVLKQVAKVNQPQSNIFISNLSINVNYNINISLPIEKIHQIMSRSPSKPKLDHQKLPSKVLEVRKEDSEPDTATKHYSFLSAGGEENVEASFRSIIDMHSIQGNQPEQLLNQLSQPILDAVSSQHGANIFIDKIEINDTVTPEPKERKLVSGYGVEETVMRNQRGTVNRQALESVTMYKQMYQSCDIQGDSIDNTHMLGQKTKPSLKKTSLVRDLDDIDNLTAMPDARPNEQGSLFMRNHPYTDIEQSFKECNLSELSQSPDQDPRGYFSSEYQLQFKEVPDVGRDGGSIEDGRTHTTMHQVFAGDTRGEHQMTMQSYSILSEGQKMQNTTNGRRQVFDKSVINLGMPSSFRSHHDDKDEVKEAPKVDTVIQSLKGNHFLPDFCTLVSRQTPDWQKLEVLYGRIAAALTVSSGLVVGKNASRVEQVMHVQQDKRRKDALICLKLLADSTEVNTLKPEVLHLLSKYNVVKARNSSLVSICERMTQKVEATSKEYAYLNEVQNAKAITESYKKIAMDKFPIVSTRLGQFLKDKKDVSEVVPRFSNTLKPGQIKPLLPKYPYPTRLVQRISKNCQPKNSQPAPVDPDRADHLVTPKMTFASESDLTNNEKQPIQKSLVLASQMNRLNQKSNILKLKPRKHI